MLLASLRFGFLLTTLVASLHVGAVPRLWTLTGVQFSDGTFASGYFIFDDAPRTIANWNVRVTSSWFSFPAFTYVPGNSMATVLNPFDYYPPNLAFDATMGVAGLYFGARQLQIALVAELDGNNGTVLVNTLLSREDFPSLDPPRGRSITRGFLTVKPGAPSIVTAQVDEFYHAGLRHYFITADAAEKQDLDTGVHPGWVRTGESFKAFATGSSAGGTINPVCRYYSDPDQEFYGPGADSHFFSADVGECLTVFRKYASGFWSLENDNAFQINLPDTATGACPGGTIPVYRLWNQRADSNHRYTTRAAIKTQMLAAGYLAEGYGADGVVMCAAQ